MSGAVRDELNEVDLDASRLSDPGPYGFFGICTFPLY